MATPVMFDFELTEEDEHEIMFYSLRHSSPVTLRELYQFGMQAKNKQTILIAAQYLHEELPIRLARRVRDLRKLPFGLAETESIAEVIRLYEKSFFVLRRLPPPKTMALEEEFCKTLDAVMVQHNDVQTLVARGLLQLHQRRKEAENSGKVIENFDFGEFLDRFYLSRVGMRVLAGQHIMLHQPQEGFVGVIQSECRPAVVCEYAVHDAGRICDLNYGRAPEVIMEGAVDMKLPYIPEHLHYIFFELLKNSMRAVVERHGKGAERAPLPPIVVVYAEGSEDVAIKISDRGGGIARSGLNRLWTYSFTTAGDTEQKINQILDSSDQRPVMAGFAHGLPLSRIHARAFGGDLSVVSMQGHGTDVYIYLSKLGDREVHIP
mmetsp:Transcript_73617/g.195882  ORF Transcript_73617/g.195882 Transcript_73617/m.195882 type:complete len:377 (-) Transcript_73617:184-1314(-)